VIVTTGNTTSQDILLNPPPGEDSVSVDDNVPAATTGYIEPGEQAAARNHPEQRRLTSTNIAATLSSRDPRRDHQR
jgi:hypothetical protein